MYISVTVPIVLIFLATYISPSSASQLQDLVIRLQRVLSARSLDHPGFYKKIMQSVEGRPRFRTIQKFKSEYSPAEFAQYESERTGMRVVVVNQKGPKIHGYFALATEIHDDSGAPHTLEHLCFMGSKSYRYKGVLDKLANRAYSGTNAWTSTDHTAYTLDIAGWEGFAQILPIYLEHVLLPTLTDSGCYTEVHHIDGTGHDAGVVYSEMQGVQNNQGEIMDLRARRLLYPEGVGFRYETGGMMDNLRVLTPSRIREFHREMYQPKNLCLILIGQIDHGDLLKILDAFENGIVDDVPPLDAPFKRPWIESQKTPPLQKTIVETVQFPEEDESSGEILIGFLGPDCNDDLLTVALDTLLVYLAGSSVSLLENTIVEKEHLASAVIYSVDTRPDTVIWFQLSSVASERLEDVEHRFFEVLREAASKPFDMEYMKECLRRTKRKVKYYTESSGNFFAEPVITDHLFGKRDGSTLRSLQNLEEYDTLEDWSDTQWREFFSRWMAQANHITILGVPSARLSRKIREDEEARVKAQKERLGKEGLERLAKKLEEAKAENDKEIPKELLERFEVPGTDSIHFIPTTTARSGLARKLGVPDNDIQSYTDQDDAKSKLFIHFEDVPTNFVSLNLLLGTGSIPVELKPLLVVYLDNFFNTPISRNGSKVEFEKVVTELEKDTVSYSIDVASRFGNPEMINIRMQVEPHQYKTAIEWLKVMLFDCVFDETRLKASVTKLLADVPDEKRSGNSMAYAVESMIHYSPESSARAQGTLVKALYLKRIKRMLEKDPATVLDRLETLRRHLCSFSNLRAFVIANVENVPRPVSSWEALTSALDTSETLRPIGSRINMLSDAGRNPGKLAYVIPMSTIESSFALFTAKGLQGYTHPRLPALMVALAYLDAVEGPLWSAVRGTGLAYGSSFSRSEDSGLLRYKIYRSPDVFKAFSISKEVINDFIAGKRDFERHALEGAISGIVVMFADEQPTMSSAATLGFVNQVMRGISKDWGKEMLKKVREVSVEDIRAVLRDVVAPVFEPGAADFVITCAKIMEENLVKIFKETGFSPEVQSLSYFQDDYGLIADDEGEGAQDEAEVTDEDDDDDDGSGENGRTPSESEDDEAQH